MRKILIPVTAAMLLTAPAMGQSPAQTPTPHSNPFERIFEYTLFDQTLPDGKHPVWIYYQSKKLLVRVVIPSLELCVVTPQSETALAVIKSGDYDVIPKDEWNMAMQMWQTAFQRDLLVHNHLQLCE
jgi:hypothetical protein